MSSWKDRCAAIEALDRTQCAMLSLACIRRGINALRSFDPENAFLSIFDRFVVTARECILEKTAQSHEMEEFASAFKDASEQLEPSDDRDSPDLCAYEIASACTFLTGMICTNSDPIRGCIHVCDRLAWLTGAMYPHGENQLKEIDWQLRGAQYAKESHPHSDLEIADNITDYEKGPIETAVLE